MFEVTVRILTAQGPDIDNAYESSRSVRSFASFYEAKRWVKDCLNAAWECDWAADCYWVNDSQAYVIAAANGGMDEYTIGVTKPKRSSLDQFI